MVIWTLALSAFLALYNNVLNARPPGRWRYVAVNLATTGLLVLLALALGVSWQQLGLTATAIGPGLRWGGGVAAVVGLALLVGLAVPAGRRRLADRRLAGHRTADLALEVAIRIPFGTVVLEEVAFRGVLLVVAATVWPVPVAALVSSAVFGLWHVMPTLWLVRTNAPHASVRTRGQVAAVMAGVMLTTLAGLGLCLLRILSEGLVGPLVAHAATNGLAAIAGFSALRLRGEGSTG